MFIIPLFKLNQAHCPTYLEFSCTKDIFCFQRFSIALAYWSHMPLPKQWWLTDYQLGGPLVQPGHCSNGQYCYYQMAGCALGTYCQYYYYLYYLQMAGWCSQATILIASIIIILPSIILPMFINAPNLVPLFRSSQNYNPRHTFLLFLFVALQQQFKVPSIKSK